MSTTIRNLLVLVAIRDESLQKMIKTALVDEGFSEIHLASSVDAVINFCEDYNYDIIITDLKVEESTSETNFIVKIRGMIPSLAVLFIYSDSQPKPQAAQYSIKKPFILEKFIFVLRRLTREYLKRENT